MATDFPTSIDSYTRPAGSDPMNKSGVEGATVVDNLYDSVEALEAKVGADSSSVNTSHDYKLSGVSDGDKAASVTGEETLTNKRLTSPKLNEDVAVSATATELNKLDGVNTTTAEFNLINGSSAGTAVASKAAVLGSNKELDEFHTAALYLGPGAGTQVTITAAQLNQITDALDLTYKVPKSDYMFRAYLDGDQANLVDGTITLVELDAETRDPQSMFSTANHYATIPVTGWWEVHAAIRFTSVVDERAYNAYVTKNSGDAADFLIFNRGHSSAADNLSLFLSDEVYLEEDDTLRLYARSDAGVDTVDVDGFADYSTFLTARLKEAT